MSTPPRPSRVRTPHPALLAAAAAYLVLRALVLHTGFDLVALPAYELYPAGTFARNLLGPRSELPLLYCYDNSLGPPLISYLGSLSFALFGPSYLALKLVSFLVMFPCLFLIWSFLRAHFGTLAASLGAFLYVLPPTTLFQYTLLPIGNHAENVTLTMLAVWAFLRVHASAHRGPALLLAGLVSGFALSIFLGALVPVALLFALHAGLVGWRRSLRELPLALAGFAAGLVPLLVANTLAGGARGLAFLSEKFKGSTEAAAFDWSLFLERLGQFFTVHLPRAGAAHDFLGLSGHLADGLFLAALTAAAVVSLPRALRGAAELVRGFFGRGALSSAAGGELDRTVLGRATLVLFFAYVPLTALAFALSDLRMGDHGWPLESAGYRYFLPTFLFALLLIALVSARLWRRGGAARAAGAALVTAALAAGCFDLALVDLRGERMGAGAHYAGYNVRQTARSLFLPQNGLDDGGRIEMAESYPPRFREQIYFGLGFYEVFKRSLTAFPPELDPAQVLTPYPSERAADLARGIGARMRHLQTAPGELPEAAWTALARYAASGEALGERVAEGLCTRWSPLLSMDTAAHVEENLALVASVRARVPALGPAALRGLGLDAGRLVRRGLPYEVGLVHAALARLDPAAQGPVFEGLGMGLADGGETLEVPAGLAGWVPPERVGDVLGGLVRRLEELHGPAGAELARGLALPPGWAF